MYKRIVALIMCFILMPCVAYANSEDTSATPAMSEYYVIDENMQVSLPDGWYTNTPDEIDETFLDVTENTENKLKKYLSKSSSDIIK